MGAEARAPLVSCLALWLAGCTTFVGEKLVPEGEGGATTTTASATTGGAGGEGAGSSRATSFLPLLDAAHVCSLIGECPALGASLVASMGLPVVAFAGGSTELRFSACVEWLSMPLAEGRIGFAQQQEILFCVAASQCASAAACLPVEVLGLLDPRCDAADPETRCEDDVLLTCGDVGGSAVRCGPPLFGPGSGCVEPDGGAARCGIEATCDDPLACDGSFAVTCGDDGVLAAVDCALFGLACSTDAPATAGCATEEGARACAASELGASTCSDDGERVYTCAGIANAQIDCDALGRTCAPDGTGARCGSDGDTCGPRDPDVDTCEGTVLHACIEGQSVAIDCANIGRTCSAAVEEPGFSLSGRCRRAGL